MPSRAETELRRAVRAVNQHFNQLKVAQAPDKTFIGKISKGFDFLGYQFGKEKITVSTRTLHNHIRRLTQLYEQNKHQPNWKMLLDDYRQHWVTCVYSGIPSSILDIKCETNFLSLCLKPPKT
jgi:RNA-directed DNA polymerase